MRRSEKNPILTRADIPGLDVSSVFNPGAVRWDGRDVLLLRVQTRGRETLWMVAEGRGGSSFTVRPDPVRLDLPDGIHHAYDARLTAIGDAVYAVFAADTDEGCRLGIARTTDFERFDLVGLDASGDRRNGVLFPERFGEHYLRLERPNVPQPAGPPTGSAIVLARSADLVTWETLGPVMEGRPRRWDEIIGSGPPPLKTRDGWLHLYHGVATHFASVNIYQAGVVLLDPKDPRRVLGRSRENILEPREPYELTGQVPNVVFPTGWIADEEGRIDVYYGAADTVVGLATTTVQELLDALS